jgi:hypothetical protein
MPAPEHWYAVPLTGQVLHRQHACTRPVLDTYVRIRGLQTVASRVHFREQYRALVGHTLVRARVLLLLLLLLRALSVLGDTV